MDIARWILIVSYSRTPAGNILSSTDPKCLYAGTLAARAELDRCGYAHTATWAEGKLTLRLRACAPQCALHVRPVNEPSSLKVRFLPVSRYLLELSSGGKALTCGVFTSSEA